MPEEPEKTPNALWGRLAGINAAVKGWAVRQVEWLSPDPGWLKSRVDGIEARGWRAVSWIYLLGSFLVTIKAWTGFPTAVIGGGEQPDLFAQLVPKEDRRANVSWSHFQLSWDAVASADANDLARGKRPDPFGDEVGDAFVRSSKDLILDAAHVFGASAQCKGRVVLA